MNKSYAYLILTNLLILISCSSDSEEPQPDLDITAPTANFEIAGFTNSSTSEPIVVSNQIEVNINAQDAGGVSKVEAYIDDQKVGEDTTAPYQITVDVSGFTSKISQTAKFKDYTLKIVVTDTSGNTTSIEQTINIDNELPVIAEVSLEADTIMNGGSNTVTFSVSDNEGLSGVKTYLNNELLSEITDANYEINIDTQQLDDGTNTLKIEAIDLAENTAVFEVSFVTDNTGPEINLEGFQENNIIDDKRLIEPEISDTFSEISSIEFILDEESQSILSETPYIWDIDPTSLTVGSKVLTIKAIDGLGNESTAQFPLQIFRRLATINLPANFYDSQIARIYVFASDMDGSLLATKRILRETQNVTLSTDTDIENNSEFILTFAKYFAGTGGNRGELTTIRNLKVASSNIFNLKVEPRYENGAASPNIFPSMGFDSDDRISMSSEGFGYGGSYYSTTKEVLLSRSRNTTTDANTDILYVPLLNSTLNEYSYYLSDWVIPQDFVFTPSLFTQDGIETKTFTPQPNSFQHFGYWVAGYFSEEDFQSNVYHRISALSYQGGGFSFPNGVPYHFNTIFDNYRYKITMDTYHTERTGMPVTTFQKLDWTVDYSIIDNNTISISKTGTGHTVGKAFLEKYTVLNGLNVSYTWNIVFDSEKDNQIILPEIPEEIQTWGFYSLLEQGDYEVQQVEIQRYEGIDSYDAYVENILKNNNRPYVISPNKEAVFKSAVPTHYNNRYNFILNQR